MQCRTIRCKDHPWLTIDKLILKDKRLSLQARGLFVICMSYPEDWKYNVEHLHTICTNGRDSLRGAIKELEQYGYCQRKKYRTERGHIAYEWLFFEDPEIQINSTTDGNPSTVNQPTESGPLKKRSKSGISYVNKKNDKEEAIEKPRPLPSPAKRSLEELPPMDMRPEIASFDPKAYILGDGKPLSLQMQRALAKYPEDQMRKVRENVSFYESKIAQGYRPRAHEAYLQQCIKANYAQSHNNIMVNSMYVEMLTEIHKLTNLKMFKTTVQVWKHGRLMESIKLDLNPESFADTLKNRANK